VVGEVDKIGDFERDRAALNEGSESLSADVRASHYRNRPFMLSEGNSYLPVSPTDIENGGAPVIEKFEESVLLYLKHPSANGVPETRGVFVG
jgi:hypothetical protein